MDCSRIGSKVIGLIASVGALLPLQGRADAPKLTWVDWSESIFSEAATKKKLVLLDLEAVWCHWCHVMEEQTYANPEVAKLLGDKFILVRADQDAHPDLSSRYKDYGWPATILFDSKGTELRKLSGFVDPEEFSATLKKVIANPKPEVESGTASKNPLEGDALRQELIRRHLSAIDSEGGGLKTSHRYLDPSSVEFALLRTREGDAPNAAWVQKTLDANLKLIDPVWGGVYQYSTRGDWDHPHFEKIMSSQVANIELYTLAYRVFGKKEYLQAAERIAGYLNTFLRSPDGTYYVSQDADVKKGEHSDEYFKLSDAERRSRGMPAIDTNVYARENGWAIEALTDLYATTLEAKYLEEATQAAKWIIANRSLPGGGFSHGAADKAGPFLGDTLAMGRGLLALYAVTGERSWLVRAREAGDFMIAKFSQAGAVGLISAVPSEKSVLPPVRRLDENVSAARFLNLLARYTGSDSYREEASKCLKFASEPKIAFDSITEAGIVILQDELNSEPAHFTVLGAKGDTQAMELWKIVLPLPSTYVRREWWDRAEGAMPNPDVGYPKLPRPAAFVCANKRCSLPLFEKQELSERIAQTFKPQESK